MRYTPAAIAAAFAICLTGHTALAGPSPLDIDCYKDLREARDLIEDNWAFSLYLSRDIDLKAALREVEPSARRAETPDACIDVLARFLAILGDGNAKVLDLLGLQQTAPVMRLRSQRERVSRVTGAEQPIHTYIFARDTTDEVLRAIPRGSEIESVNGVPLAQLREREGRRVSGSTEQWRDYRTDEQLLVGAPGSRIELTYRTPGGTSESVTLVRPTAANLAALSDDAKAQVGWAKTANAARLEGDWGYLRFSTFDLGDAERTIRALDEALNAVLDAPGLIIDLRGNDAGHMDAAIALAERFIAERQTLGYYNVRAPGQDEVLPVTDELTGGITSKARLLANPRPETYAGPVVILIDAGCFSACEVFSGGLQGLQRALVIGSESSGGGSGPAGVFQLPSGATISFSTSVAWLPDGQPIDGRGIAPNISVMERARDWAVDRDRVLDRAIKALEQGEAKPPASQET
jgi:carboxyl-terminal processing protease